MPEGFDTAAKRPNKTTAGYGSRFDTALKIIEQNQQTTKSHPFRQYIVLPCSPLFGIHNNRSALRRDAVLSRSPVFSIIKAATVVLDREFGGRFLRTTHGWKAETPRR